MSQFNNKTTGVEVVNQFKSEVDGKTILITGTSVNGLGAETAISLAHVNPAHILLLARSANKVIPVQEKIKELNSSIKTTFVPIELDDFDSVRVAAEKVNTSVGKIDILINNAGIMAVKKFTTNKDGIESQFATNHLGHFLLTNLLFDKVKAAGPSARIVNVTSDGFKIGPCRFEDYNFKDGKEYDPWSAYGQSKTANILFTRQLANKGRPSFAVHPGVIMSTSLGNHVDQAMFGDINDIAIRNTGKEFIVGAPKPTQEGVSTTLRAALDPSVAKESGSYFENCNAVPLFDYASSMGNAQRLWALSEKLVGQKFDL